MRGRDAKSGSYFEFYQAFQAALVIAKEEWIARFRRGDVETTETEVDGTLVSVKRVTRKRASDAWKWLSVHFPAEFGDAAVETLNFHQLEHRYRVESAKRYGTDFSELLKDLITGAKSDVGEGSEPDVLTSLIYSDPDSEEVEEDASDPEASD